MPRRGIRMADLGDFSDFDPGDDENDLSRGSTGVEAGGDFDTLDVPSSPSQTGLGTIAVSEGLTIGESNEDTRIRAYVTSGNRRELRLGTYVIAPYPDGELLFCRISALEYAQEFEADDATEIHARRAMDRAGFEERDYKFIASLEPLAVLTEEEGTLQRRMADRVPKPETVVRAAADQTEIKTGLDIPEDGIFVGHLAVGGQRIRTAATPPTIDYRLRDDYERGDPLVFRHTLIAGGTGSGKTHAAKNILRQYLGRTYRMGPDRTPELAVVQFDPQDEYAQMHDDNPALLDDVASRYAREDIAIGGHAETRALVPAVSGATYEAQGHRAEWIPFTIPFSLVRSNPWLATGAGLNDHQYQGLRELLDQFFDTNGNGGTYSAFLAFLDDPARRESLDERGIIHEATYDAIQRRVRGFGHVFDQDAEPITELVHELVRPGGLTTVPTYHIGQSRAVETIVLAVASLLVDQKLSNDPDHERIKDTPLVIGMDEAHNFLTDAESAQAKRVIGKFADAAKQGRKERLGLFLITQDPQDIAEAVFKQINTNVVLNLGDEAAINAVNLPTALEGRVPYMEQGGMVVHSPDNSEPVELAGLPYCVTRHGRDT